MYQDIINFINNYIKTNGQGEITGSRLNQALNMLANYYGFDGVTVTTLPAGSEATATVTNRTLNLGIPAGQDGRDGMDGMDATNPFKGWWPDLATLKANVTAMEGDAAYVKDASPATTWSIYIYDSTASTDNYWADSGTDVDTSNVQTFASGQEVNEVSIVDGFESDSTMAVPTAKSVKILNDRTFNDFVDVDNSHFYKNGTISTSGSYISNTSAKIYRYAVKQGQTLVFYCSDGSTAYAALSYSQQADPSSFLMIMMYITGGNYYSYTAPNDGYVFVLLQTGATGKIWYVNPQEPELNRFGVGNYGYGENAIKDYVGSDVTNTTLWGSGFFTSTGGITSGSGYHYSKGYIRVQQGSYIQAGMTLSGNARICYYKEDKTFLSAVSTGNATASTLRTIPENAYYMRFCMSNTDTSRLSWVYQNELFVVDVPEINQLNARVDSINTTLSTVNKAIDNNLLNESNKIDGWRITADGSTFDNSNYGQPNIRYIVPVDNSANLLHIKVKFQFTRSLNSGSNGDQVLLLVGDSSSYQLSVRQYLTNYDNNAYILNRKQYFIVKSGGNIVGELACTNTEFKQCGDTIAYTLEYKGTEYSTMTGYKLKLNTGSIQVVDGSSNVVEEIAIDTDELLSSVIDKVNTNSNYLRAVPYEVAGLKYVDCTTYSTGIPLCVSSSSSRPWMFYKNHDTSWHELEVVLDYTAMKTYTNIDGATIVANISTVTTSKSVYIGRQVSSATFIYSMVPVLFRDLHIGYDWEDAEVITYPNNISGTLTRLISNDSPYLIIYEGHGMQVAMNKDMPTGQQSYMDVSTDALRTIFEYAASKGFKPVSWKDIIDWKLNGKKLPKRCYTIMFDDFQIDNYMKLAKRIPFEQYNVKPGLAIITGSNGTTRSRSEQVTIDGQTWTLGEVFDAIIKAGWYPCSHTRDHVNIGNNVKDMELLDFAKTCIYSCDKIGIYDNIIVNPEGGTSNFKALLFRVSGFKLGVIVSVNGYNCKASLEFRLIRNEIGSRKALSDILAQIV